MTSHFWPNNAELNTKIFQEKMFVVFVSVKHLKSTQGSKITIYSTNKDRLW